MVKSLLKKGEASVKSLTNKNGNKFDAVLKYERNPNNNMFSWKIESFENK